MWTEPKISLLFLLHKIWQLSLSSRVTGSKKNQRTNEKLVIQRSRLTEDGMQPGKDKHTHTKKNFSVLSQWYIEYIDKAQGIYIACYSSLHSVCIVIQLKWFYFSTLICFTICCITAYNSSCNNYHIYDIMYQRPKLSDRKTHAFRSFSALQI